MPNTSDTVDRRRVIRGPAAELLLYEGREALCEGPTRTGKSWALLIKADYVARSYPGSRQLIARQTRKSLNESILVDWRNEILWLGHPAISKTASRDYQDLYRYPNGSEIYFVGLESMQDTSSPILSTKWDRIYVIQCEELKDPGAWETLATRLSSFKTPYHQMVADCNPAAPSHWLNKRFQTTTKQGRRRFLFRHWHNPFFYNGIYPKGEFTKEGAEYVGNQEALLTGIRFQRYHLGQWVAAEGMILDNWDPARHVIDFEIEKDDHYGWLIHRAGVDQPIRVSYFTAGVDWGWAPDPGCMSLWAYDSPRWHPKIRRFRVHEVMKLRWQREEWVDLGESWAAEYGARFFSCDRSDPENINYFNQKLTKRFGHQQLCSAVKCPPIGGGHRQARDKSVQIDLMREGLLSKDGHQRTYLRRDGFPEGLDEGLRATGQPTCYEEEIEAWTYLRKQGSDRDDGVPDDKCADHALDSARYDETLNFARGFGKDLDEPQKFAPGTYGEEMERVRREQRRKRGRG